MSIIHPQAGETYGQRFIRLFSSTRNRIDNNWQIYYNKAKLRFYQNIPGGFSMFTLKSPSEYLSRFRNRLTPQQKTAFSALS